MRLILLPILFFLLLSCSSLRPTDPTIDHNTYFDSNTPKIEIHFPFNVYYSKKVFSSNSYARKFSHKLKTDDNSESIFIEKTAMDSLKHYFTKTDDSRKRKPFYLKKLKTGYCSVDLVEHELNNYIEIDITKYRDVRHILSLKYYKNVGYVSSKEIFKKENAELINEFIKYNNFFCDQFFSETQKNNK